MPSPTQTADRKRYFSPSTKGFYLEGFNDKNMPKDAVEITEQEYKNIHDQHAVGGTIMSAHPATGKPMLTELVQSYTYSQLRASEYPPMVDYLDAVVKGDVQAQQDYIRKCLEVKAKYPKPTV